jgi:hypothetical protein
MAIFTHTILLGLAVFKVDYQSLSYAETFDGFDAPRRPLKQIDYGNRLLSKISGSLELGQICDAELISVDYQRDESCDIEITASVVLILKEVNISDVDEGPELPPAPDSKIEPESYEERTRPTDLNSYTVADDSTDRVQNTAKGIPLQLWRYINGGPMLDYDDAYTCSLSNAIRSLNWGACGHALKRTNTEMIVSEDIVLRTPSWILLPKRDDSETYFYKTASSVAAVAGDDVTDTNSNGNGHTADDIQDSCDDISDNSATNGKRQKVRAHKSFSDDAGALQISETVRIRKVEPCQMIVLLDVNTSTGDIDLFLSTKLLTYHDTVLRVVASDILTTIPVVPYSNMNKTAISQGSRAFQTTLQKGIAYEHIAAHFFQIEE